MAKAVMAQLIKKGKVTRGWLGVSIQSITPELAKQLKLKDDKGTLVTEVIDGGPAAKGGLQSGDTIVMYDDKEVTNPSALKNLVASTTPGKQVTVKYIRDGAEGTAKITIQEYPEDLKKISSAFDNQLKGVSVQNLTPKVRKSLNLPGRVTGVIISDIDKESPAFNLLATGDIIMEVNRKKISSVSEYEATVAKLKGGQKILLLIYRNGASLFVAL
jgi:serine protease Do